MRKLCLHLSLIGATAAFAVGCEDGPSQTFQPAPANAASSWNGQGGNDAAVAANGNQDFDAGYPTSSKTSLCSTDFKRARWAWMLVQPIQPPRLYAGLDMAKDDLWTGLKIEDAENPPSDPQSPTGGLCQSNPFGFQGTCPSGFGGCNYNSWGNNQEVGFSWNVATHLVDQMLLNLGYTGTLTTNKYPDHNGEMHSYTIQVGDILRRDGLPYQMNWSSIPAARIQITDFFNAIMATFSVKAGVPFDTSSCTSDTTCNAPGTVSKCECNHAVDATGKPTAACVAGSTGQCGVANCGTDGNCLVYNDGSVTIFGIRPMIVYIQGQSGVPQPAESTPTGFYNFFSKWEPFSNLPQVVKIDGEGPVASGQPIGIPKGSTTICNQKIGQTFADFRDNCVQVHGDKSNPAGIDVVNLNKVVHSLVHDQEHWTANVLGVNQNFTSLKVINDPNAVVLDTDQPQPSDIAQDWTFDVRARGHVQNDYAQVGPGVAKGRADMRGSALLFIEWARLMLADIGRITGRPARALGDPACTGFDATGKPNYQSTTGCSGVEGLIVPHLDPSTGAAYGDFTKDPVVGAALDPGNNFDVLANYASALKPGDLYGQLCIDPGSETDCAADNVSVWTNMQNHVIRVMGNGDVNNLPSELRDRRYFFKWFGVAYVKYLKAYGTYAANHPATVDHFPDGTVGGGLGPSDVMNTDIDREALFFDYLSQPGAGGAQTFDKFEYVDRDTIGTGSGGAYNWIPWDFEYGCDLKGGNQRYDNWFRRMDREEIGLYSAMLVDKTKTPGAENNVNITNLFGSVLVGGNADSAILSTWLSYACAVGQAGDASANCVNPVTGAVINPPLDMAHPNNPSPVAGACAAGRVLVSATSYENGTVNECGLPCNFATYPASGCANPVQTCVFGGSAVGGCADMKMDRNLAGSKYAKPMLSYYPAAWTRSPFSRGHSPITIKPTDKHPEIGVAHVTLPNFKAGPYTKSPVSPDSTGKCGTGFALSTNGTWCNAALNSGTGTTAATFNPFTPWAEVQPEIGFSVPIDGQHDQWVSTGQFDYTGVLESYIVDYLPWVDPAKSSCVADGVCNKGYTCNHNNSACETDDNTVQIAAIEGTDFLGEAFVCVDPFTSDVLHVRMYDSVTTIVDWLAAHPGGETGNGITPSAQAACQIIVRRTPYDNYIDSITSKSNGVHLNISGGQGLGRVTDIILFDPSLIQAL